jgi:alanine racemase
MKAVTYALIDQTAIQHNLAIVHNYAPDAKVMAVIKSDGYGHGLIRIAKALADADALAVARIDEAIRLRQAGFQQRLTILEGFMSLEELAACVIYHLEPVIHCMAQVNLLEHKKPPYSLSLWLKLDTGMNRLGFNPVAFPLIYTRLQACLTIEAKIYLMTHLANADDLKDTKTLKQLSLFNNTVKTLKGECSVANSAGILGWPSTLTNWVRPGIMLYGISPFIAQTGRKLGLKSVMSLHSQLIAIKTLKKGDTVGYGSSWVATKTTRLGIVAIGYGDGYPHHAKIGTPVLINGQRVPLIGRVSMDMLTVDLSAHSHAHVYDSVTLWGNGLAIEEIANCANTIAYTLVCGITPRVQRFDRLIEH